MTLDLSPEAMALIRRLIETRAYPDPAAVVEDALRMLAADASPDDETLRRLIAEADASGETVEVDLDTLEAALIERIRARA
jgi:Arc/MetJ-type ribon-helix-helix transcriptional regulator